MAKQLTAWDLASILALAKRKYPNDWRNIPVYIGDDEELNGIHNAFFVDILDDKLDKDELDGFIEMINERGGNTEFDEKAILIS